MRRRLFVLLSAVMVVAGLPGGVVATGSPPQGGAVDDGWLPPAPGTGFAAFESQPPPGGGPVWPGLLRDARRVRTGDGEPVDVGILHFDATAEGLRLAPLLAGGSVRGLATVPDQGGDPLATRAVAGINGGFWLSDPVGEPNGFFAVDGRLVSEAETQGAGPRGAVGITRDGSLLIDRLRSDQAVFLANGAGVPVAALNRGRRESGEPFADGPDALLAYTPDFGGLVVARRAVPKPAPEPAGPDPDGTDPGGGETDGGEADPEPEPPPALAVFRVAAAAWPVSGVVAGTVTGITRESEGTFTVNPGEVLLVASGQRAEALAEVGLGDPVTLATTLKPLDDARVAAWQEDVVAGLAAGPLIVRDGAMTDPAGWTEEGFDPGSHSGVRAPRSAIATTADGRILLVTADGRRPGVTVGFTMAELAQYLIALGAVEALSLDGGASSQMVVDGVLRNVPCCDAATRRVATSLFVHHDYTFTATQRLAGPGRVDTAAAVAASGHPDGADEAVLAVASDFPDALAGGPLASALGGPLLLVARDGVPEPTRQALGSLGVQRVTLLGGEAVIDPLVAEALQDDGLAVRRLAGPSRVETAAAVSAALGPSHPLAFLAWQGGFADALVAAAPAGLLRAPILLTGSDRLHPASAAALRDAQVAEVVIVGGHTRISQAVEDDLRALGVEVTRLAGEGRYATAAVVNDWALTAVPPPLDDTGVVVASGDAFPDALAGGPLAAARRQQLMIVPQGSIDADMAASAFFSGRAAALESATLLGGLGALGSYHQWQLDRLAGAGP